MSLSISKLQQLIAANNFQIRNYFTENKCCFYIDVFDQKAHENFMIYIPCKYNIETDGYEMTYLHVQDYDNITNQYVGGDKQNLEKVYGDMKIELLNMSGDIEKQMENRYKREISFPDVPKEDVIELRSIYRQLKRLKYTVENIKHKIGISYKNYICSIRRNGMIDCYHIKKFPQIQHRKLFVIVDLETFFEKNENLLNEIKIVRTSIHSVLGKTQSTNINIIKSLIANSDLNSISSFFENKRYVYDIMLSDLEQMAKDISIKENEKLIELKQAQASSANYNNLQTDINRVNRLAQLQKEAEKILSLKADILQNIDIIRDKKENTMLIIDKIVFDNTVMYDCIIKNFSKLREFYK
jgi:hypothetical protein